MIPLDESPKRAWRTLQTAGLVRYSAQMSKDVFLSIGVVATFALILGAISMWRKQRDRKKAGLMFVAALVLFGNVLIIAWP